MQHPKACGQHQRCQRILKIPARDTLVPLRVYHSLFLGSARASGKIRVTREVRGELLREELSEDRSGKECALHYSRPVRTTRETLKARH